MGLLVYGIPILIGFVCGYIFTVPVNVVLSLVAGAVAGWMLWSTRNAEIGGLIGVIAVIEVGIALASLWITAALIAGWAVHFDFHWLLRSSTP